MDLSINGLKAFEKILNANTEENVINILAEYEINETESEVLLNIFLQANGKTEKTQKNKAPEEAAEEEISPEQITIELTYGFPKADKPRHIRQMSAILSKSNYKGLELSEGMKSALAEIIETDAKWGSLFGICIDHDLSSTEENFIYIIYEDAKGDYASIETLIKAHEIDHEIQATKRYFYYVAPDEEYYEECNYDEEYES